MQETASNMDAYAKLRRLMGHLSEPTEPYETPLAAAVRSRQQAGALFAISALCMDIEDQRRKVLDQNLLPYIIAGLSSSFSNVRCAAAQCTRSLSRSINILKTAFLDTDAAPALFGLLSPDQEPLTQLATTAVMCNVFIEFSPLKNVLLDIDGVVERVVAFTRSDQATKLHDDRSMEKAIRIRALLKHHALTAIKNMTYWSSSSLKIRTTECLTWEYIVA